MQGIIVPEWVTLGLPILPLSEPSQRRDLGEAAQGKGTGILKEVFCFSKNCIGKNKILALWLRRARATAPGNSGKADLQDRLLKLQSWVDTI